MSDSITAFVDGLNLTAPVAQELQVWMAGKSDLTSIFTSPSISQTSAIKIAFLVLSSFFNLLLVSDPAEVAALDVHWYALLDLKTLASYADHRSRSAIASQFPSFIALPKHASEVSITLRVIKALGITFSVRSAGHSPNPGWSSTTKPGVVIDLRELNEITISQDKSVISLGTGATWGDVYEELDTHGVSVIGSRNPAVGVGGLVLGGMYQPKRYNKRLLSNSSAPGGFHHFSGQYGLAADNVKNFEVATLISSHFFYVDNALDYSCRRHRDQRQLEEESRSVLGSQGRWL